MEERTARAADREKLDQLVEKQKKGGRRRLPESKRRKQMSITLPPRDFAAFKALAEYWGTNRSEAFRTMIRHFETNLRLEVKYPPE